MFGWLCTLPFTDKTLLQVLHVFLTIKLYSWYHKLSIRLVCNPSNILPAKIKGIKVYEGSFILLTGNRYISVTACMWIQELAQILDDEFRPLGELIHVQDVYFGMLTKE